MPNKIKILLFTMIAGSGLIAFSIFTGFKNIQNLGANIGQMPMNENNGLAADTEKNNPANGTSEKSDIDQDGLFDEEEPIYRTDPLNKDTDGDGFLDGEEVAAGCSPISASPKDCDFKKLGSSQALNLNLTQYFGSLIVGGLLSKDLDKTNPKFNEHIKTLADEMEKIQKTLLALDDSNSKIELSDDDSKIASQIYLNELEKILEKYFFKNGGGIKINGDLSDFDFSPYIRDLNNLYNELSNLRPNSSWADLHQKLLTFFGELKIYFANLDGQSQDPVKTLLTLKGTAKLLDEYENLTGQIAEKIRNDGLKSRFFNL